MIAITRFEKLVNEYLDLCGVFDIKFKCKRDLRYGYSYNISDFNGICLYSSHNQSDALAFIERKYSLIPGSCSNYGTYGIAYYNKVVAPAVKRAVV